MSPLPDALVWCSRYFYLCLQLSVHMSHGCRLSVSVALPLEYEPVRL